MCAFMPRKSRIYKRFQVRLKKGGTELYRAMCVSCISEWFFESRVLHQVQLTTGLCATGLLNDLRYSGMSASVDLVALVFVGLVVLLIVGD
jgi:hypothetical protein